MHNRGIPQNSQTIIPDLGACEPDTTKQERITRSRSTAKRYDHTIQTQFSTWSLRIDIDQALTLLPILARSLRCWSGGARRRTHGEGWISYGPRTQNKTPNTQMRCQGTWKIKTGQQTALEPSLKQAGSRANHQGITGCRGQVCVVCPMTTQSGPPRQTGR
jgi:hypothetical protein